MLLGGRAAGVLAVRARHAAAGAERRVRGAAARGGPAGRARAAAGAGPEPGPAPGPGRQLALQPAPPPARHRLPRGQDRLVRALQRRGLLLEPQLVLTGDLSATSRGPGA